MIHHLLIYLAILFSACKQFTAPDKQDRTETITNTLPDSSNAVKYNKRIEQVNRRYFIGDVNNDKIADTAFVDYNQSINAEGTIEKECVNKNCEVTIRFNHNVPDLVIDQSLGIYIKKVEDLNNDNANEIILFSQWFEGYWNNLYVWTFKGGTWKKIARTKAFVSEDKDFESRIIRAKSQFYLLGDEWDNNKGGVTDRSIKIKIEK